MTHARFAYKRPHEEKHCLKNSSTYMYLLSSVISKGINTQMQRRNTQMIFFVNEYFTPEMKTNLTI